MDQRLPWPGMSMQQQAVSGAVTNHIVHTRQVLAKRD